MTKKKILIIEDDKFLLKLYGDKLRRAGFEVAESVTGEEALNKISVDMPDLIILDLILPKKSGFEILTEFKLNPKTKNIPVIILTNLGQESDIKKARDLGVKDYLIKADITPDIVVERIRKYIK